MNQETKHTEQRAKSGSKIGAVIILIISALVFLPFGASAVFQSVFNRRKANSYGSYGGRQITYEPGSKFFTAVSNLAKSYQNMGYKIDDRSYYSIMNQAFKQTVLDMAFTDAVKKSGYSVPKSAVNREVAKAFTDSSGTFLQKRYNQMSQADLAALKADISGSLVYGRYVSDVLGTGSENSLNGIPLYGLKRSSSEKQFLAKMGAEKHSFEAAAFSTGNFPAEEAAAFGRNNAQKFRRYSFSVITADEESEAKSLHKQISGNEITFEDAASEKSQKYYSEPDGKMAASFRYQLENMLASADSIQELESLQTGEVSGIIQTMRGYSIFRCDGPAAEADFSDEKTQNAILSYMKASEKGYIENYYMEIADNFVSEAALASFDSACEKFNVEKKEISPFPINYGDTDLFKKTDSPDIFALLPSNEEAYVQAFSLGPGEIGAPFVLGSNVIVLKCTGIETDSSSEVTDQAVAEADMSALQTELFASSKVEDNFFATYISLMSENRNRE